MDRFARVSWLEDNFVLDLVFYPVKLLTYDMDSLVGVIVLLNDFVNWLVPISRYFEGRGYNLLSEMIKCYGFQGWMARSNNLFGCVGSFYGPGFGEDTKLLMLAMIPFK